MEYASTFLMSSWTNASAAPMITVIPPMSAIALTPPCPGVPIDRPCQNTG